jgi:hypothetical protein
LAASVASSYDGGDDDSGSATSVSATAGRADLGGDLKRLTDSTVDVEEGVDDDEAVDTDGAVLKLEV